MRIRLWGALLLGGLYIGQAAALTEDGSFTPYASIFGIYELNDANRASDNGIGFQITGGLPLTGHSSLELSFVGIERDRNLDGRSDYKNTVFVDYLQDFGYYKFALDWTPAFKPYLIGGVGYVREDTFGDKSSHFAINGGGGVLVPLKIGSWDWGWAIRSEAKVLAGFRESNVQPADRQTLVDFHLQVGLQIPLSFIPHRSSPVESGCRLSVVDPISGRRDCLADSDGDGVEDGADQCPNSLPGVKVNERGCAVEDGGDVDNDGVLNGEDLCPNTANGLVVDAKGCAIEQTLVLQSVNFESASAVLTGQATLVLDNIAQSLNGQKNVRVQIGGHTDNSAGAAYNLLLSQQRAESVRQYLIGKGVDAERMNTLGYGETMPLVSNRTPAGREQNRRVEFQIIMQK